jgi:type 1 fimbriae regulatory protein FimB/type 1 fimbriae regulatory protein FimE
MDNVLPFRRRGQVPAPVAVAKRMPPRRLPNLQRRSREHLTAAEVDRMVTVAGETGRHRIRDPALILLAYHHGLRVSELVDLRWEQVDLDRGLLHVNRKKRGSPATHPLTARERATLAELRCLCPSCGFIFLTERGGPITASTVRKIVARAGRDAGIELPVHPHMLRHATGYYLANKGVDTRTIQAYLGHRNIHHTVRYTQLAADRFRFLWSD